MNESTRKGGLTLTNRALSARTAVLEVAGRMNAVTAPALRARVEELIEQGRPEIVCDLAGVTFLDSSGLAGLVVAIKAAASGAGSLKIAASSEAARLMFRMTGLDAVLELHPSVESVLGLGAVAQALPRAA